MRTAISPRLAISTLWILEGDFKLGRITLWRHSAAELQDRFCAHLRPFGCHFHVVSKFAAICVSLRLNECISVFDCVHQRASAAIRFHCHLGIGCSFSQRTTWSALWSGGNTG